MDHSSMQKPEINETKDTIIVFLAFLQVRSIVFGRVIGVCNMLLGVSSVLYTTLSGTDKLAQ